MSEEKPGSFLAYLAVALLSSSSLLYEVSLTRILGIAQGHHLAFFIVSTALLGLGISGSFLVIYERITGRIPDAFLVIGPLGFSVAAVSGYLMVNAFPFDILRLAWDRTQIAWLGLAYGVLSIPFFFSGLTLVTFFRKKPSHAGRIYYFDLLGGTAGALLPILLYPLTGAIGAILLSAGTSLVSGGVFTIVTEGRVKFRIFLIGASVGAVLLVGFWIKPSWYEIRLSPYSGLKVALNYPEARHLASWWTVKSRIDIVASPAVRFAPGMSLSFTGSLPAQIGFTVDAGDLHAVTRDKDREELRFLEFLPSSAPYQLGVPENLLILRGGGGLDAVMAVYFGVPRVEVLVPDQGRIDAIRNPVEGFGSDTFVHPGVRAHASDFRSFLASSDLHYDLMVLPLTDTLGASGLGIHGFSENYDLTKNAFRDVIRHLSPEGWFVVSQYLQPIPVQEGRLFATVLEALEELGLRDPSGHLIALRSWGTMTLMLKRTPISPKEIQSLQRFSKTMRFDLDYYPGISPAEVNRFNRFREPIYHAMFTGLLDRDKRKGLYGEYPFLIRPVTDDRPFFGYVLKLFKLKEAYRLAGDKGLFLIQGGLLLPVMLIQAMILAGAFILLPMVGRVRGSKRSYKGLSSLSILLYFMLIGLSFMAVEIVMIQRLILLLGHPVYSVSLVLGGILFFAGTGSLMSGSAWVDQKVGGPGVLLLLSLLLLVMAGVSAWIWPLLMGAPIGWRISGSVLVLGPLGILMGMPFPMGIVHLKRSGSESMIPWAWAVNGTASVVGAILAAFLAMEFGFYGVLAVAAAGYAVTAFCFDREAARA